MRCARCGNENPETNRFCGMCGATLLQAPAAGAPAAPAGSQSSALSSSEARAAVAPTAPAPTAAEPAPASPRTSAMTSEETPAISPVISGPSFLGLNDPPPRKRGSLSIDPRGAGSRNLDYLLDDEEEPKRGGAGKFILFVLALALAAGLGYLRWKNQGFDWLNPGASKPAATQNSQAPDAGSQQPATANPEAPNASASQNAGQPGAAPQAGPQPAQQPTQQSAQPAPSQAPSPAPSQAASQTTENPGSASSNPPPAATAPTTANSSGVNRASNAPASSTPAAGSAAASPAQPKGDADTTAGAAALSGSPQTSSTGAPQNAGGPTSDAVPATKAAPKPAPAEAPSKPSAAVKPARAFDPVSEAQKYIDGRGVRQDCDRGLRLLKPAADQENPKAMIEMGALYSAGLCTPRDLPTAYRWFALALRKDPNNQSVQTDLEKLWGEMTQPERQLAIRLSQ